MLKSTQPNWLDALMNGHAILIHGSTFKSLGHVCEILQNWIQSILIKGAHLTLNMKVLSKPKLFILIGKKDFINTLKPETNKQL